MNFFRDFIRRVASSETNPNPIDPSTLQDSDFDDIIECLSDPDLVFAADDLISRAGARAEPALLRAMRSGMLLTAATGNQMYRSPLQIVGFALIALDSRDWAECVRGPAGDRDDDVSRTCRVFLGHTAGVADVPLMRQILETPGTKWRVPGNDLASGLAQRLRSRPNDASLIEALFEDLWRFSLAENAYPAARALLLRVDRKRTVDRVCQEFLADSSRSNSSIRLIEKWIGALVRAHVRLDSSEVTRLLHWAAEVRASASDDAYFEKRLYGSALMLAALARSPEAKSAIDAALAADDPIFREGLRALALWHDIDLWDPEVDRRTDEVPTPVQYYRAVCSLDGEIGNGGISQYFGNSSGDHARLALEALAAMGDETGRTVLLDAMKAFGPRGPSPDRVERNQQLDAMLPTDYDDPTQQDPLAGIDDRWSANSQQTWRLLLDYMIQHREHFTFSSPD